MKNFKKILSLILSLALLLSVCFVGAVMPATATTPNKDYYVGYNANGYEGADGLTVETRFATVAKAIEAANAQGTLTDSDTVNVYIVQDIDSPAQREGETSNSPKHNLAYWGGAVEHSFKLSVKPYSENQANNPDLTKTYLATDSYVAAHTTFKLGGDTEFDDLELVYCSSSSATLYGREHIVANGHNLTLGSNITYGYIPHNGNNGASWTGAITTTTGSNLTYTMAFGLATTSNTYTKPMTLTFNANHSLNDNRIEIPSGENVGTFTFNENVTLVFNNASTNGYVRIGGYKDSHVTTFKKNLNFKYINAAQIRLMNGAGNITVEGGVQFLIKTGISEHSSYTINGVTKWLKPDGTPADVWKLYGDETAVNTLEFTGETGKFSVPEGMGAIATLADGGEKIYSENGILDLSAAPGEYNVSVVVKTYDYYVQGGATGDGMSEASPAPSVKAALTSMVSSGGLAPSDTANIWIMQTATDITTNGTTSPVHNLAYLGTLPEFDNKIIISAHSTNTYTGNLTKTMLLATSTVGTQTQFKINGPTVFDNVQIVYDSKSNLNTRDKIIFNGNDVKFTANTTFAYINANGANTNSDSKRYDSAGWPETITNHLTNIQYLSTALGTASNTYNDSFKITYNNTMTAAIDQRLEVPSYAAGTFTFDKDVTIEFTGNNYKSSLRFGGAATQTTTINGNLNFRLEPTTNKTIRFYNGTSNVVVKGGVQFINNGINFNVGGTDNKSYTNLTKLVDENGNTAKMWYLNVTTNNEYIDFIEGETGKFSLSGTAIATATHKTSGNLKESEDGVLDLSGETGEYDITIEIPRPKVYDYYVKVGGTGDGTSVEAAAPTVSAAIATINELRLNANETANIYLIQEATTITADGSKNHNLITWGSYVEHDAKIVLKGYSENVYNDNLKYPILAASKLLGNDGNIKFGGPTVIDDVCIMQTYGISNTTVKVVLNFNAQDVTITENARFAYFNGRSDAYSSADAWANADFFADGKIIYVGAVQSYITNGDTKLEITKPVNVTINKGFSTTEWGGSFYVIGDSTDTFKEDVTVNLNLATSSNPRVYIGKSYGATFEKNLNVKLTKGNNFGFNPDYAITVNGGIQFIYSDAVSFNSGRPYNNIDNNAKDADGNAAKSWIIKVADSDIDTVNFTSETGKFTAVKEGYVATAVNSDKTVSVTADQNGMIDLSSNPGEYIISFKEYIEESNTYAEFINYRGYDSALSDHKYAGALANTYTKIKKGEDINVVYLGGSVTAGAVSETGTGCWRARVGDWLTRQFPEVKINNYNQAIGETGTRLASYRVERDIISKEPDVLFLEYSINDYYDRFYITAERASIQYETVVRKVKENFPDCDIITVLVTDAENVKRAGKDGSVLHSYSKAHEAMAKEYNISTINVGQVLSNKIYEEGGGVFSSDIWYTYVKDSVHPYDLGYGVYFDVIKEFLANTLVFSDYNTTVKDQELPELVSKYLVDGEIEFIDDTDERVSFTTTGGTAQALGNQGIVSTDYSSLIITPFGSEDTVTVTFTGTELVMLTKAGALKTVAEEDHFYEIVSIDGEPDGTRLQYQAKNPSAIVNGLQYGEHTIVIRPSVLSTTGLEQGNYTDVRIDGFYARNVYKMTNKLDIRDLVALDEMPQDSDDRKNNLYDYDNSGGRIDNRTEGYDGIIVNEDDFIALRRILLNNKTPEEANDTSHLKAVARLGYAPYTGSLPEQSIMSYQKAYEMGHDILLADIRVTSDGAMVCVHDDDISKVHAYKDGEEVEENTVLISQTTIADLLTYDFGAYRGYQDLQVLRLEDFMEFCAGLEGITPCLEIKEDTLTEEQYNYIVDLVKQNGFEQNIMFVAKEEQNKTFADKLPYSVVGDWVSGITDTVINRVASYGSETNGRFIYVANGYDNEYTINYTNYARCKRLGIDIGYTYIANNHRDDFDKLKARGIFNYCKFVALDEPSWLE